MKPRRPYLLRAMREWVLDNGWTPHVVVDVTRPGVAGVPPGRASDGRVVLDIGPLACPDLRIDDGFLWGSMRFGGVPATVTVPLPAVLAVYAAESMEGLVFPDENPESGEPGPPADGSPAEGGRPRLRRVK